MASEKIDALELDINAKLTTKNLDKLITALGRLSKALDKVNAKRVKTEINETGEAASKAAKKTDTLSNSFLNQAVRITALIAVYRKLGGLISDGLEKSMSYVENLNLFTVSLGEYAENAQKYGETVKEALGIDPSNWMRTQGVFNTLIKGFGVAGDQAAYMSQNLTQLTYDIASFYNLSISEAEQKLQSAVAGELEPVRRLGYDLSQSKLTEIAQDPKYYGRTTYAVNQETGALEANSAALSTNTQRTIANFNELTQGEKVQLRYIALMTQVTQAQGDMARTLNDPANQMRIFKEQINQTSRAFGNVFIPALNQVLPYITAFCQLLERGFNDLARLFGFEIPDMSDRMDVGSSVGAYDDIADATGRAAKNAKKLKDYTLGIDELNVFKPDDKNNGGGGSGAGNYALGSSYMTPGYDFLASAIENRIEQAKKDLEWLQNEFKKNPLVVTGTILWEGMGELGSKFWEAYLGMSPQDLKKMAEALGVSVEKAFFFGVTKRGYDFWLSMFGVTWDDLRKEAEENGTSVRHEFDEAFLQWVGAPARAIMEKIFGTPEELAHRVVTYGVIAGKALGDALFKGMLEALNNPVTKPTFEALTGIDIDATLDKLNKKFEENGEKAGRSYAAGFDKVDGDVKNSSTRMFNTAVNGADANGQGGQKFYNTSANEAYKYAMGLTSSKAKSEVFVGGTSLATQGVKGARAYVDGNGSFTWVGDMSGAGYVGGIKSTKNLKSAMSASVTLAKNTLKRLKEALGIASPSKEFEEQGMYSDMGLAVGIKKYAYLAEDAAKEMANASLNAVETANSYFESNAKRIPTTTNAGYGIGAENTNSMATLASNIYNAVISGMSVVADRIGGDTIVTIDGKEIYRVVQKQDRNSGVAIGNGAFA